MMANVRIHSPEAGSFQFSQMPAMPNGAPPFMAIAYGCFLLTLDLQHMARHRRPDPITTRQCEKLLELRDDAEYYSSVRGFGVQSLIQNCWLARDDLESEDDRKFIEHLKETSCSSVKRRQLRKLLACARQLGEIEQYVSIDR
jgi:hypothetical protein